MGSIISLGVGRLEIDWGKNDFFRNHSKLFLKGDIKPETYYYADDQQEVKPAYSRPLRSVKRRLELLGYSVVRCRRLYEEDIEDTPDHYPEPDISFDVLCRALAAVDVDRMTLPDGESGDYDLGEFAAKVILADPEFTKTEANLSSLTRDDGTFFENLDPYIILRLLCENPANLDYNVIWRFQDVLESGWISEDLDDLHEGLADEDRYLIVTEGSSDSSILKASLPLVAHDVADFFTFIDMSENYPFTGTGNLFRFCQGLATIGIQNKILVVLDSDTAGLETFERIRKIPLPDSMRVVCLPPLDEFKTFKTIGPSGESQEDVNGKAVAIECFLDLKFAGSALAAAAIRWTSYNPAVGAYQGELVGKDKYTRAFFGSAGKDPGYDLSKLSDLWQHLLTACAA
jgi:hypothetical protein